MPQPLIALLTDFGTSDPYVGVMKGIIAARCPDARFIDLTHEVSPQNVRQASYLLHSAYRYFPAHTIFLVVVDPRVGTERKSLAIQTDHGFYVGPNNGIFGSVLEEIDTWQAVILSPHEPLSATFHGRDVFAPAAADLACGSTLSEIGAPTADIVQISLYRAERLAPDSIDGEIIHIDHFGNLITSLGPFLWENDGQTLRSNKLDLNIEAANAAITVEQRKVVGIRMTYGQANTGELLALINSDQQLEIAVNQGSAAQLLGAKIGDPIQLVYRNFKLE